MWNEVDELSIIFPVTIHTRNYLAHNLNNVHTDTIEEWTQVMGTFIFIVRH
jgi:hypothetical protein